MFQLRKGTLIHTMVLVLMAALIGMPAGPVYAAADMEDGEHLEDLYQRELQLLDAQAQRLAKTGDVISRVEDYIAAQQQKGADTSGAEAALEAFRSAQSSAQSWYDQAAAALAAHAGFDSSGKVTDAELALETVRDAGSEQRQFHLVLVQALDDLREALTEAHTWTGMQDAWQKLQEYQQVQEEVLLQGQDMLERLDTFITRQGELGRDTEILVEARTAFQAAYASAEGDHEEAGAVLQAHSGFDGDGIVTDPDLAKITLTTAGGAQRQFHITASQARIALREALQAYRALFAEVEG